MGGEANLPVCMKRFSRHEELRSRERSNSYYPNVKTLRSVWRMARVSCHPRGGAVSFSLRSQIIPPFCLRLEQSVSRILVSRCPSSPSLTIRFQPLVEHDPDVCVGSTSGTVTEMQEPRCPDWMSLTSPAKWEWKRSPFFSASQRPFGGQLNMYRAGGHVLV